MKHLNNDFFNRNKNRILVVVCVVLVALCVFTLKGRANVGVVGNVLGFVITPVEGVFNNVSDFFGSKLVYFKNLEELAEENELLKQELAQAKSDATRMELIEEENITLSALLELKQKYPSYDTTAVRITSKSPSNWYDDFIINKGENDGISVNTPLITEAGLIGRVYETGSTFSKAITIVDANSSVSAMSLRTGDIGVVKGDFSLTSSGLCKMEYIDSSAEIIVGDEIVTSDISDLYPAGIRIGYVKEIKTDSNGLTKYAIIQPEVDFSHMDTLLAITSWEAE